VHFCEAESEAQQSTLTSTVKPLLDQVNTESVHIHLQVGLHTRYGNTLSDDQYNISSRHKINMQTVKHTSK
jgi:hypothetical protein